MDTLAVAISSFFGTRSYSTSSVRGVNKPLVITFYGIAENTVAAAHAFKMTYNLLVGWSLKYKGTSQRNSYCLGVGRALQDLAKEEKDEEERAAIQAEKDEDTRRIRQEEADEQARLDRLNPPSDYDLSDGDEVDDTAAGSDGWQDVIDSGIESENDTDGEEDDIDEHHGLDSAGLLLSTLYSPEPASRPPTLASNISAVGSTVKPSGPTAESASKQPAGIDSAPESSWSNHAQLVAYRNTREKMAEDFLKERNIKLGKARAKKINNLDRAAYDQGREDAKNIDVRRRALRE